MLLRTLLPVLLVLGLAACAQPKIEEARGLAQEGLQAATRLQQGAQSVYAGFAETRKLEAIELGLVTESARAPTINEEHLARITVALRERVTIAAQLVSVYAAFGDLAQFDARGEFETSLGDTIESINAFAAAVNLNPIGNLAGEIVEISGGLIASEVQRRRLLEANDLILQALRGYSEMLHDERGEAFVVGAAQDTVGRRYAVTRALWDKGLLNAKAIVDELVSKQGLKLVSAGDMTSKNAALDAAMNAYFDFAVEEQRALVQAEYDTSRRLIDALIAGHETFAQEQSVSFDAILAFGRELVAIAERLQAASATTN